MNNITHLTPGTLIGDNYQATLQLPAWQGYQSRQGSYNGRDKDAVSDGTVKVFADGRNTDTGKAYTQQQANAIKYVIENDEKVRDAILAALLSEMPSFVDSYEDGMPIINSIEDFKNNIGLSIIHIMPADKEDHAYVGFEFGCEWDVEHGMGIMTHKDRIISIGQADVAFDDWITYEDNGSSEAEEKRWNEENPGWQQRLQATKKPWWKFW
ncbi:DUF6985 domain-containing protein [Ferruginibacter sp.]